MLAFLKLSFLNLEFNKTYYFGLSFWIFSILLFVTDFKICFGSFGQRILKEIERIIFSKLPQTSLQVYKH